MNAELQFKNNFISVQISYMFRLYIVIRLNKEPKTYLWFCIQPDNGYK